MKKSNIDISEKICYNKANLLTRGGHFMFSASKFTHHYTKSVFKYTEPISGDYKVYVNGQEIPVYTCRISAYPFNRVCTATIEKINLMIAKVDSAYEVMIANLTAAHEGTLTSIANAYDAEEQINALRNELREAEIEALDNNDKNYQTSVYYIDIINELEHMGDFMINISQSLERAFVGK